MIFTRMWGTTEQIEAKILKEVTRSIKIQPQHWTHTSAYSGDFRHTFRNDGLDLTVKVDSDCDNILILDGRADGKFKVGSPYDSDHGKIVKVWMKQINGETERERALYFLEQLMKRNKKKE